jgi:tetratricopeptide (TPR) repeat protein
MAQRAQPQHRVRTLVGAVVVAVLLLIGVGSYAFVRHLRVQQAEFKAEEDRRAAQAEANRKLEEAGKQRLATEQERQARAVAEAEAEAKRKSEEAEQQRVAALRVAEEEAKRTEAETRTRYAALVSQGNKDSKAGNYDRAIADYNEAIRLDSKSTLAFIGRGDAYTNKSDHDRALADYNEVIRLDPKSALALSDRGVAYAK